MVTNIYKKSAPYLKVAARIKQKRVLLRLIVNNFFLYEALCLCLSVIECVGQQSTRLQMASFNCLYFSSSTS